MGLMMVDIRSGIPFFGGKNQKWMMTWGVLSHRGTPSHHPYFRLGFSMKSTIQLLGYPPLMEAPNEWENGSQYGRLNNGEIFDGELIDISIYIYVCICMYM